MRERKREKTREKEKAEMATGGHGHSGKVNQILKHVCAHFKFKLLFEAVNQQLN